MSASAARADEADNLKNTIAGLGDATLTNSQTASLTFTGGNITRSASQPAGLTLHAGAEADGPYNLSITATDTETDTTASAQTTIAVTVNEQADRKNVV